MSDGNIVPDLNETGAEDSAVHKRDSQDARTRIEQRQFDSDTAAISLTQRRRYRLADAKNQESALRHARSRIKTVYVDAGFFVFRRYPGRTVDSTQHTQRLFLAVRLIALPVRT